QLNRAGDSESLKRAIEKYIEAANLYRESNNPSEEASALNYAGLIYNSIGEKQKALGYFNQALPLRRAIGDRSGEATTLSNIGTVYSSIGERMKALDYFNQALLSDVLLV